MNKKGQELTIGTLILIVLGIVILVMVILGFAIGWENLFEKIKILPGGTSIASKESACRIALSSNTNYDFCKFDKVTDASGNIIYINCLFPDVAKDLQGSLTCANDAVTTECTALGADAGKYKVNGQTCAAICGNKICEPTETASSCAIDCPVTASCNNNGICDASETNAACPHDCFAPGAVCTSPQNCKAPMTCKTANGAAAGTQTTCQ